MEYKNYRFVSFLPDAQKKIQKKFRKFKNTIVDSFQAKIDLRRMRKRENKNYSSVTFLSNAQQKIPKRSAKQFKKLKNTIMASFQAKIGWKRLRKRENKNWFHFKPKQVGKG